MYRHSKTPTYLTPLVAVICSGTRNLKPFAFLIYNMDVHNMLISLDYLHQLSSVTCLTIIVGLDQWLNLATATSAMSGGAERKWRQIVLKCKMI